MSFRVKPRAKVPATASAGEVVTIKTLITHPMESGHRTDLETGALVPRHILNRFTARFNGLEVLTIGMEPAIAANPYFEFEMRVPESGTLSFEWVDDDGMVFTLEKTITVV